MTTKLTEQEKKESAEEIVMMLFSCIPPDFSTSEKIECMSNAIDILDIAFKRAVHIRAQL